MLVSRLHKPLRKKTQNLGLFGPILGQRGMYQQIAVRPDLGHSGKLGVPGKKRVYAICSSGLQRLIGGVRTSLFDHAVDYIDKLS